MFFFRAFYAGSDSGKSDDTDDVLECAKRKHSTQVRVSIHDARIKLERDIAMVSRGSYQEYLAIMQNPLKSLYHYASILQHVKEG
jgi:ABC-type dipeptide/oligopeptide/nickel transport system ATPase component